MLTLICKGIQWIQFTATMFYIIVSNYRIFHPIHKLLFLLRSMNVSNKNENEMLCSTKNWNKISYGVVQCTRMLLWNWFFVNIIWNLGNKYKYPPSSIPRHGTLGMLLKLSVKYISLSTCKCSFVCRLLLRVLGALCNVHSTHEYLMKLDMAFFHLQNYALLSMQTREFI